MEIDMEIDELDNNEYEEEEYLLYIDIDPTSLSHERVREARDIKLFGLDTQKPLLKINNHFFEGEYDVSMGTHMFFEEDDTPVDELYCKCNSYYKCCAKTNKLLKMSRVLLKEKTSESKAIQEKDIPIIKGQLKVRRTYEEALSLFLDPGRDPPRRISEEDNFAYLKTYFQEKTRDEKSEENDTSDG